MLRTRAGYCGGEKIEPTYRSIGDHTEAISIDFDPAVLSLETILEYFWNAHDALRNHTSRQYMHAFFYRNEEQKAAAGKSRDEQADHRGLSPEKIATHLLPAGVFTIAEGYHQKYYLTRYRELRDELERHYPSAKELADSTVATRLNAFLGSGMERDWSAFAKELPEYGLPEKLENAVKSMIPR